MKVLYDHQTFEFQNYGGISKYFCELYNAINQIENHSAKISALYSDNIHLQDTDITPMPTNHIYNKFNFIPFRGKIFKELTKISPILKWDYANQNNSLANISINNYDIFHPTYYNPYFVKTIKKPFVITIHDMIHEYYPQYFNDYVVEFKRATIHKATKIIAVSNYTKEKVCAFYGIDEKNVDVIHHGINHLTEKQQNNNISIHSKPFILYVGTRDKYKNFYFYILSIASLLKKYDIDLIAIGAKPTDYEKMYVNNINLEDNIHFLTSIPESKLNSYYSQALFLAYPSLVEGFGMPILEAFNYKTPVMISDIPVFREVAGESGIYFNSYDENDIKTVTDFYINNPDRLKEKGKEGYNRARAFSWADTAKNTISTYESCL